MGPLHRARDGRGYRYRDVELESLSGPGLQRRRGAAWRSADRGRHSSCRHADARAISAADACANSCADPRSDSKPDLQSEADATANRIGLAADSIAADSIAATSAARRAIDQPACHRGTRRLARSDPVADLAHPAALADGVGDGSAPPIRQCPIANGTHGRSAPGQRAGRRRAGGAVFQRP